MIRLWRATPFFERSRSINSREASNADSSGGEDELETEANRKRERLEVVIVVAAAVVTCGLCGLAAEVVLGAEVNWEKPYLSASFGLCNVGRGGG